MAGDTRAERPERKTLAKKRDMFYENFRFNLRALCSMQELNMVELARKMEIKSGSRLSDLYYGRGTPNIEELDAIVKYFNVTMDNLLYKKGKIIFE